jgi:glycosyltransferase involved in cell wall biosynthesis
MAFFSVITINLNNREGLERTIQSVRAQHFKDYEYIVVDGQSTDGSLDVLSLYDAHITRKIVGKDSGVYHAMNKGLKEATGEYIVFLNSGDEFKHGEVLTKIFEKNGQKDLVYCDVEVFQQKKSRISVHPNVLTTRFLLTGMICHQAIFARRRLFELTGPFSEEYKVYGDYEWLLRAVINHGASVRHIARVLVRYEEVGLSNTTDKQTQRSEKDSIQNLYFSAMLLRIYRAYRWIDDWKNNYFDHRD